MPFMPNIFIKATTLCFTAFTLKKIPQKNHSMPSRISLPRPLHCHLTRGWRAAPLHAPTTPTASWGSPPSSTLSFLVLFKSAHSNCFLRWLPPSSRLLPVHKAFDPTLNVFRPSTADRHHQYIYSYALRRCTSHLSPDLLRYICHTDLWIFFSS
jgi:hypothetical protein